LSQAGSSLWDGDVVEAFIGSDPKDSSRYAEFEVAPTNEKLDLLITHLPEKDFTWSSGFTSTATIEDQTKVWICQMAIPLKSLAGSQPSPGTTWRVNLYRCDRANRAALAWVPTLEGSFHVPGRFAWLRLAE